MEEERIGIEGRKKDRGTEWKERKGERMKAEGRKGERIEGEGRGEDCVMVRGGCSGDGWDDEGRIKALRN